MKDLIFESWRKFLKEARDFPSIIQSLVGSREGIYTLGIMTAENPNAQIASPEDNAKFNSQLEQELRNKILGYRKIRGKFKNEENSYLIPNVDRDEMIELGRKFNQESVIWGQKYEQEGKFVFEYIESATGTTTNKRDVVLIDQDIQSREDFYSQSKKGPEKFVIPFFDDEYEMIGEYNIPNANYDGPLNEEINKRVKMTLEPNRTGKSKWYNRGVIKELNKKTWKE